MLPKSISIAVLFATLKVQTLLAGEIALRDQELKTRIGVGYAVRLIDMNDDKRLDIVVVDQERILWLANPDWSEHVLIEGQTKKDNVCFAPYDIDGDGKLDFAVGADWNPGNTASGGTIQWIRRPGEGDGKWSVLPIGEEPTTHRMQFVDLDADGRSELVVAPLLGKDSQRPNYAERGVRLLAYKIPADPIKGPWVPEVLNDELHVCHNFWPTDLNSDGKVDLVAVSFEGVHLLARTGKIWQRTRIGIGNQETSPNRGASEIRGGRFSGGRDYLATIEPWHGSQVVVYRRPSAPPTPGAAEWLWERKVIDDELQWGHAVWCANLDQDADDELIIGVRDDKGPEARRGLRIYDPKQQGESWTRTIVDPGSVAIEDLAAADLNGDGRTDIVAVGRQTHNIKIYWNETR